MKEEIRVGVEFLRQFLAKYGNNLHQAQIDLFALKLSLMLQERYVNHWYDAMPMKGQAFRCLRVKRSENYVDPVLEKLLFDLKLNLNQLGLPNDFTLWIDPGEVSVRFGDQVGYTYTIARLNVSPTNSNSDFFENNSKNTAIDQKAEKPCLVVQNAEKILFDEKLTAFIRQNSCNNTNDEFVIKNTLTDDLANDFDDDNKSNDFVIDELIKLSAEKRTISPPHATIASSLLNSTTPYLSTPKTEIKRQNSSNIEIVNNNDASKLSSVNNHNSKQSNNNTNFSSNRLSFNDSCYYSSSSSSCASSFESNDETNLMMRQFGWFNHTNNMKSPEHSNVSSKVGAIGSNNNNNLLSNDSISNTFYKDSFNYTGDQQQSSLPFSQTSSLFSNQQTSFIQPSSFGFSPFNNNNNNQNNLYGSNNGMNSVFEPFNKMNYLNLGTNSIYSDASSERSDTPNSCITTSSYMMIPSPLSFNNKETSGKETNLSANYFDSVNFIDTNKTDLKTSLLNVGSPENNSSSSSTSSDGSTKTIAKNIDLSVEDQIDSSKMDLIVESSIDEAKTRKSDSNSPSPSSPNSDKNKTEKEKKEESYCGYVESFPYYYKLNRLYNALAVQKMQTERLRKSGIYNPNTSNASSLSTTPNNTPNPQQTLGTNSNNNNNNSLFRNSPKTSLGTSPNQYVMNRYSNNNLIASPSSSPSFNNSSILNSTSPPGANMSKAFNSRINNLAVSPSSTQPSLAFSNVSKNNGAAISPVSRSPSNNQVNSFKSQNSPKQQNFKSNAQQQIGYPMSPTNAAISYANHQNRNNVNNNNNNNINRVQNYQQSRLYAEQQHQHQQPQQQLIQSNLNNSLLFETNINANGNNNFLIQQQQQQQQQQEIINNIFNQMNIIRSQDLVKSKN